MTKCVLPWTSLKMYSNHCFSCCMSEYGSSTMPPIGNISRDSYLGPNAPWELWNSDIYVNMREAMLAGGLENACITGKDPDCPFRCGSLATNVNYLAGGGFHTDLQRDNEKVAQKSFEAGELIVSHYPIEIEMRLDTVCNLACEMCTQIPWKGEGSSLPKDVEDSMDEFLSRARRLTLTGGEPTISPLYRGVLRAVKRAHGAKIFLITNGHFLKEAVLGDNESCFSLINVSLDAGDPDTYAKVRKGGKWGTVATNVAEFMRRRPPNIRLFISCVIGGLNFDTMDKMVKTAADLGVDHVILNEVHSLESVMSGDKLEEWTRHKKDQVLLERCLDRALEVGQDLGIKVNYSIPTISRSG